MKKSLLSVLAVAVVVATAGPARAVTNGQPDANRHPYVGLVTDGEFACSGAAVSPTVFLTAAHCFGAGARAMVTFDPDARAGASVFHAGTFRPHPSFCIGCSPGLVRFDTGDVAVVVLDEPVALPAYARLPKEGLVDALPDRTPATVVGYGDRDRPKDLGPGEPFTRRFARTNLVPGDGRTGDELVKLAANPSSGGGGTCFGDSGGPALLRDTTTVLAVTAFVTNGNCAGVTYSTRVDTPKALAFVESFL